MIKRVAIARAISMKPNYLFCDEPNSGLDPQTSIIIDNLILELTQELNITTVVNTHDMNSVIEIGDNIAFLYKGRLAWKATKTLLLNRTIKNSMSLCLLPTFQKLKHKKRLTKGSLFSHI